VRYLIRYENRVSFAPEPVREHQCELRIAPRDDVQQSVRALTVAVEPEAPLYAWRDCFGNRVHCFSLLPPHQYYAAHMQAEVETLPQDLRDYDPVPPARERQWIAEALRAQPRLLSFLLHHSPATPEFGSLAREHGLTPPAHTAGQSVLDTVHTALQWISEHFAYDAHGTRRATPLQGMMKERRGNRQDFSHLLIAVLRHRGIPARYVAGYRQGAPDAHGQPEANVCTWVDALIPGAGWRGFDAARRQTVDGTYIAVALGRDHSDAEPTRGAFKGAGEKLDMPAVKLHMTAQQ
jgi:transglutaminase-like putative cysteine protease